jgi:hypothetical protein
MELELELYGQTHNPIPPQVSKAEHIKIVPQSRSMPKKIEIEHSIREHEKKPK